MPPRVRPFHETGQTRFEIFDRVTEAFKNNFPLVGKNTELHLDDVRVKDKKYTLADQKKALLEDRDLSVPLVGSVSLRTPGGKKVLDRKKVTLARVPYMTPRGTVISKGNEYALVNQFRLRPGVYNRVRENGELESHFNVQSGTGPSFRLSMDPESGVFRMGIGNSRRKLYPLLRAGGVDDETLANAWGSDVLRANQESSDPRDINNVYRSLFRAPPHSTMSDQEKARAVFDKLGKARLDPSVTTTTLGRGYKTVEKPALVAATQRILGIARREQESDDRDSLSFRTIHGPEDFLAEKVAKDAGGLQRKLMWKMDRQSLKTLKPLAPGYFTPQLKSLLQGDNRALPLEEINPIDLYDQQHRVVALGEGGIPSLRSVPDEARNVHGSQFGIVDPIRGPESAGIGVDVRLAHNTYKGADNQPYTKLVNARTGKLELVSPQSTAGSAIAFPGEWQKKGRRVRALVDGKLTTVDRRKVSHYMDSAADMMAATSNLVPMHNAVSGNRLLMAGKAFSAALPFETPEAPLVQSKVPGKEQSFDNYLGRVVAAHTAKEGGTVARVGKDQIHIRTKSGKIIKHDRYQMFPFNRSTFIDSVPVVKAGQEVRKGDMLARTNFTDDEGTLALGKNLKVGYIPYKGYSADDGIVISETAAKKLSSEHLYSSDLERDKETLVDRDRYVSYFPTTYQREQVGRLDKDGVIQPGMRIKPGDPLILSLRKKSLSSHDVQLGKLHKALRNSYLDNSVTWDQDTEGEVIDVVKGKKGIKINVRTVAPAKVADKLSGRFGNKGVISRILPDGQMPTDESGEPMEILLNPLGVISRINPAQAYEATLGKIAKKTGKPILVENFSGENYLEKTKQALGAADIKDTETLIDPVTGKKLPGVLTGYSYMMKIAKTAKSGFSARGVGPAYTSDMMPAKGGKEGAKRIGNLDVNALVVHNARDNLRDMFSIKGQRNDKYWRAVRLGYPIPSPEAPFIMSKFRNSLIAAGVNVDKKGNTERLLPLTDKEIDNLSKGEISNARMFRRNDLAPEKGGLFDFGVTGGPRGERWAHVPLSQPIPNPIMEEPVRRMLGLTEKKMRDVLAHQEELDGKTGGAALKEALSKLDVDAEIEKHRGIIDSGRKSYRDNSVKTLGYLKTLKQHKLAPQELMLTKVPVIPPVFRPVTFLGGSTSVVSAANQLYADLMHNTSSLKGLKEDLPTSALGSEHLGEYDAVKAVVGLGNPVSPKTKAKAAKGFIRQVIGNVPKMGMFQRKVISKPQDLSGRAVVIPDPSLDMDEVGLPTEMAWKIYRPFIMRDLVRRGMSAVQADEEIEQRSGRAKQSLDVVMTDRPVIINRAPTLHKFNILAVKPKLRSDKSIAVSSLIAPGFNLDHDGDQMNAYVPASEDARKEALERLLPSKNLFALRGKWPIHTPVQDAVLGLYKATTPKKGAARQFASKEEAIAAYRRGEIDINDPIDVPL